VHTHTHRTKLIPLVPFAASHNNNILLIARRRKENVDVFDSDLGGSFRGDFPYYFLRHVIVSSVAIQLRAENRKKVLNQKPTVGPTRPTEIAQHPNIF